MAPLHGGVTGAFYRVFGVRQLSAGYRYTTGRMVQHTFARDTARVLHVSPTTVIKELKKKNPPSSR